MTALIVATVVTVWFAHRWRQTARRTDAFLGTEAARHCADVGHEWWPEHGSDSQTCNWCGDVRRTP